MFMWRDLWSYDEITRTNAWTVVLQWCLFTAMVTVATSLIGCLIYMAFRTVTIVTCQ